MLHRQKTGRKFLSFHQVGRLLVGMVDAEHVERSLQREQIKAEMKALGF